TGIGIQGATGPSGATGTPGACIYNTTNPADPQLVCSNPADPSGTKDALADTDFPGNTGLGHGSISRSDGVNGSRNTAIGFNSLFMPAPAPVVSGHNNTAVGFQSMSATVDGNFNTAVGSVALFNN